MLIAVCPWTQQLPCGSSCGYFHTVRRILTAYHNIRCSSAFGVWAVFVLSKSAFAFFSLTRTFDILLFRIFVLQMTGGYSSAPVTGASSVLPPLSVGIKVTCFTARFFVTTASSCADTQRSDLSSFRYSYLCIIPLGCPMSLCAWKCL